MKTIQNKYNKNKILFVIVTLIIVSSISILLFVHFINLNRIIKLHHQVNLLQYEFINIIVDKQNIGNKRYQTKIKKIQDRIEKLNNNKDLKKIIYAYSFGHYENSLGLLFFNKISINQLANLENFLLNVLLEQKNLTKSLQSLFIIFLALFSYYIFKQQIIFKKKLLILKKDKELNNRIIKALEYDRQQISFDLHDSVLQKLAFIKMQTQKDMNIENYKLIKKLIGEAILELRTIYLSVDGQKKEQKSFVALLESLYQNFKILSSIDLEMNVIGLDNVNISQEIQDNIFKIVHELLANGYKHSNSTKIKLNIYRLPKKIRIIYSDNGNLIKKDFPKINSITYRVNLLNATMMFPMSKSEYIIQIEVPI